MPELVIFVGIPACGKSTFHENNYTKYIRINLDTLKTRAKERKAFEAALAAGEDIVIDNTNVTKADRAKYIEPAKKKKYHVTTVWFNVPKDVCLGRNENREAKVSKVAIHTMAKKLEPPTQAEGVDDVIVINHDELGILIMDEPDPSKKRVIGALGKSAEQIQEVMSIIQTNLADVSGDAEIERLKARMNELHRQNRLLWEALDCARDKDAGPQDGPWDYQCTKCKVRAIVGEGDMPYGWDANPFLCPKCNGGRDE